MDMNSENGYVASIMTRPEFRIVIADESHLNVLTELAGIIEAEDHPGPPMTIDKASEGVHQSLRHFDALNSDCVWFLIAFFGNRPAGLAILTRIPKLDQRL